MLKRVERGEEGEDVLMVVAARVRGYVRKRRWVVNDV